MLEITDHPGELIPSAKEAALCAYQEGQDWIHRGLADLEGGRGMAIAEAVHRMLS